MIRRRTVFRSKVRESVSSVLPITAIVFLLVFTVVPVPNSLLMAFIAGAFMLVIGMGFFTLGTDLAMSPIGESVGSSITGTRKLWFILLTTFLVGTIITISEPDLQVLARQVPNIPNMALILCVAVGVGILLVIAVLRIVLNVPLAWLLAFIYAVVFIIAMFVPKDFISVAFDSGGVTTGPMTVPFIMALGVGIASIRDDKNADDDSFGLVALCSAGPVIAVMLLSMTFSPGGASASVYSVPDIADSKELILLFIKGFPNYIKEVALALAPIAVFFALFQIFRLKLKGASIWKIIVGLIYTFLGLVLFLTGVNVGFMPVGYYIGSCLGSLEYNWIIIPIGMVIGYFMVAAEPAVHVLKKQVYELTAGSIPQKAIGTALSAGVSISVGLSMVRILYHVPIMYFIAPGYAIAIVLMFFTPKLFTAIAFDSGGVASGPITATFLLPLAMGVCSATGGSALTDAFGVVALVAMTPLIAIQVLGIRYNIKSRQEKAELQKEMPVEEIIR